MKKHSPPDILSKRVAASSQLFTIESLDLRFSNGEERTYERMKPSHRHAVMSVPVTDDGRLMLIREYAAGTESYALGFPKGLIDLGEEPEQAANRELAEEIGFSANQLLPLKKVILAPSYFSSEMTLFLAQDLYPCEAVGDEPEPLEILHWPLKDWKSLLELDEFNEARSITALMMTVLHLNLT
ncbi:ADP compounds hydrolase NudE [Vibrio sp. SS-MA-C1-2]|uniref:ADP compounds hydrolase NudE n=1 Tax=Vibrio sp. SS-MA-C1-2 TaxID=2908646 RepID=UPI001F460B2D|nr:ADP compounds hydrolase NudE [Vibrio sp. SS-MA-C1-2]UJF19452.1 ADP compounds hydrolase NudE [Vibrio sp. SS-MA-C1-2]